MEYSKGGGGGGGGKCVDYIARKGEILYSKTPGGSLAIPSPPHSSSFTFFNPLSRCSIPLSFPSSPFTLLTYIPLIP